MIDIKFLRENPDIVKENIKKKFQDEKLVLVDEVIELDVKNRDHQLVNNLKFQNCRECHIELDWLLIYKKDNNNMILFLIETGSHSDLF